MKQRLRHARWLVLPALLLFLAGESLQAQTPRVNTLPLTLRPNRQEYWVGEPVVLTGRLVNWWSPRMIVYANFTLSRLETELFIIHAGKWGKPYRGYQEPGPVTDSPYLMRYGKAHEFPLSVLYSASDPGGLALAQPGDYQFRLSMLIQYMDLFRPQGGNVNTGLEALSPVIRVVEPPADAAGALALLRGHPLALRDLHRLLCAPANRSVLEEVVRRFPGSRYAPFCLHALANLDSFFAPVDPEQAAESRRLFRRIVAEYPDYAYRDDVRVNLAETDRRDGHLNRAAETARELLAESEDNLYRYRKSPIMRNFRGMQDNPFREVSDFCWELFGTTELNDAVQQMSLEKDFGD